MDGFSLQVLDTSNPVDRSILESPQCVGRLNEIERVCQAVEPTENAAEGLAFSVLKDDFLARPFLYKRAAIILSKASPQGQITLVYPKSSIAFDIDDYHNCIVAKSGQFDSIQCLGVKSTWLQGKIEQVAFVFLTRTHPDGRRLGSTVASAVVDFAKLNITHIFGYVHEDNIASIMLLRKLHSLSIGHHRNFLLNASPFASSRGRVSSSSLRALSVDEANACYSSPLTYGCRDFSLANFREILDHPNHRGTFVLQGREGTLGGSVWDMSGLGSLVLRGQPRDDQRYALLHNLFFLPRASSPSSSGSMLEDRELFASLKLARERMLPEFIALVLAHCSSTLGVAYVVVDDDGRDDALVRTLRSQFAVVGETSEYINTVLNFEDVAVDCQHWADAPKRVGKSYPANEATGRACSCAPHSATNDQPRLSTQAFSNFGGQQQFLDPRDFSTLLSFKQYSYITPRRQEAHL